MIDVIFILPVPALVQFTPPANFSANFEHPQIGIRGFLVMLIPNLKPVFRSEACMRHFYQDYANFYQEHFFFVFLV